MKRLPLLIGTFVFGALTTLTSQANHRAEVPDTLFNHQVKMQQTMAQMDSQLKKLEHSHNVHDGLSAHYQLVHEALTQMKEMAAAKRADNAKCIAKATSDDESCYEVESHSDTQLNMLVKIMENLLERQAILEKQLLLKMPHH